MRPSSFLSIAILSLAAVSAHAADSLLDLPAAVKTTISSEAGGKDIRSIERLVEDGQVRYYVIIPQDGFDKRVTIGSDGSVVSKREFKDVNEAMSKTKDGAKEAWEKTKEVSHEAWQKTKEVVGGEDAKTEKVSLNQLPVAARATFEREAGSNHIGTIVKNIAKDGTSYTATLTDKDGVHKTLTVSEDGAVTVRK